MATTTTLLTFEDFEQLPSEPGKMELLDGELIHLPPAKIRHTDITHWLFRFLEPLVDQAGPDSGLGGVYMEAGYQMGPKTWLQPDVSITHAGQPRSDYMEGAPALAIEVISPSNRADQMDKKVKTYLANGGKEVWVVYPGTRCVWVYREGQATEFREVLHSEIIKGLRIDLAQLFA